VITRLRTFFFWRKILPNGESSLTISVVISVRLIRHRISFSDPATCYAAKWRSLSTSIQLIRVASSCFKAAASPLNTDMDGAIGNICKRASSPLGARCSSSKKSSGAPSVLGGERPKRARSVLVVCERRASRQPSGPLFGPERGLTRRPDPPRVENSLQKGNWAS